MSVEILDEREELLKEKQAAELLGGWVALPGTDGKMSLKIGKISKGNVIFQWFSGASFREGNGFPCDEVHRDRMDGFWKPRSMELIDWLIRQARCKKISLQRITKIYWLLFQNPIDEIRLGVRTKKTAIRIW